MTERRILVTAALPYANGHIHLGHMLEHVQTDVFARFQRLRGHRCLFICADDTHGTAIMMRARAEGRSEEEVIADMKAAHEADFAAFDISFDHYGSTNSKENRETCGEIWKALNDQGLVESREVTQFFDPDAGTFLADRFIKGTCPKCGRTDQYGDSCECGHTYDATDLIDPKSTLSGATPLLKSATHLFVEIERLHEFLDEWTQTGDHVGEEVRNYLKGNFLGEALRPWDISRPQPYFGFEIPDHPGHCWFVWFDAPIGYIASTRQWCEANGDSLDRWWRDDETEIVHVIGKDIIYFHTLFWPAMLKGAGISLPKRVQTHGFLTVDGEKMSKRRGTFVLARTYLEYLDPSYLRYYFASKLGPRQDDIDLNLEDLAFKVNADLVGKVVNLASRSAKFVQGEALSKTYPDDGGLFAAAAQQGESIAAAYERFDNNGAIREILALADAANRYVEAAEPWALKKDPARKEELRDVCTVTLNLFRQVVVYLAPVLPRLAEKTGALLGTKIDSWDDAQTPLVGTKVEKFQHMMQRVDPEKVTAMIAAGREVAAEEADTDAGAGVAAFDDGPEALAAEPLSETEISIDDFVKVDLRVARIIEADHVEGAQKLLQLRLSLGGDVRRTVFAGIKSVYAPEDLIGRLVIVVANLAPRKMRFGLSEGMVLAAGPGGDDIHLLSPDSDAKPGQRVH